MNPDSAVFMPIVRKKNYKRPFNIEKKLKWMKKNIGHYEEKVIKRRQRL